MPPEPGALVFGPADDDTFARLFAAAAEGSLDVMIRRELESSGPEDLARAEIDYYRACPGDRSWWHTAATTDGTVVGIAIPSATPTNRNVGYLAVLTQHRGRAYVDEILAFITRFHAEQGPSRHRDDGWRRRAHGCGLPPCRFPLHRDAPRPRGRLTPRSHLQAPQCQARRQPLLLHPPCNSVESAYG